MFLLVYLVFINSYCWKLPVTFHDLKRPWSHDEGLLGAVFRFRVSSLPETRCLRVLRMVFVQKKRLSIVSHWLIIERSQNWPELRSRISKFWDKHFIDTDTGINRWKFQRYHSVGVAMASIQTFMRWGHLTWPGDLTLSDLFLKVSQHMRKNA